MQFPNLKKYELLYDKFDEGHNQTHMENVRKFAVLLAKKYSPEEVKLAYIAATLHDIGLIKDRENHEKTGAKMIANDKYMQSILTPDELKRVVHAIGEHRASTGKPKTTLAKIVSDADRSTTDRSYPLFRATAYGIANESHLTLDQHLIRSVEHLADKYGPGGYARVKLFFPETEKLMGLIYDPYVKMAKEKDVKKIWDFLDDKYRKRIKILLKKHSTVKESKDYPNNYKLVELDKNLCNKYQKKMQFNVCKLLNDGEHEQLMLIDPQADNWVGYITYSDLQKRIRSVEVNPQYRRQGIAKKLLNIFPKAEMLFTRLDNNPARSLYESIGWKDYGIRVLDDRNKPKLIMYTKIPPVKTKSSKISGKGLFLNLQMIRPGLCITAFKKVKNTGNPDVDYTRTEIGKYVNHSNKPNLKLHKVSDVYFFSPINEIKKGEELTIDYKTFPWKGERSFVK